MKKIIVGNGDEEPIIYKVSNRLSVSAQRVARAARELLDEGATRYDPEAEPMLKRGAEFMSVLGAKGDATLMVGPVHLMGAHASACLCAEGPDLTPKDRKDFVRVLKFLGDATTCFVLSLPLPPLRKGGSSDPIRELYQKLRDEPEAGFWEITLTEATDLLEALQDRAEPEIKKLCADLQHVTANRRSAFAHLSRAGA